MFVPNNNDYNPEGNPFYTYPSFAIEVGPTLEKEIAATDTYYLQKHAYNYSVAKETFDKLKKVKDLTVDNKCAKLIGLSVVMLAATQFSWSSLVSLMLGTTAVALFSSQLQIRMLAAQSAMEEANLQTMLLVTEDNYR